MTLLPMPFRTRSERLAAQVWDGEIDLTFGEMLEQLAEHTDDLEGHCQRVAYLAVQIAKRLGFTASECERLEIAAALHDYGKLGIPMSILMKPGPLNPDERRVVERHPVIGARLLDPYRHPAFRLAAIVSISHHEAWDGSGYPYGIAGEAIPLAGRIVAVCDVYDALTSDRCYRPALPVLKALTMIREDSGRKFDPKVVDALCEVVGR